MFLLIFSVIIVACRAEDRLDLNGQWFLDSANGTLRNIPVKVPGGIYTDLIRNNIITDVLYNRTDTATRWVANTDWVYHRDFIVTDTILRKTFVNIVFEGLDTIATVSINNQEVGNADNMFRRYIFNIKDQLVDGTNTISITFKSPILEAARLAELQSQGDTELPSCTPTNDTHGECYVSTLRKMQASFAWDWAPAVPSVGIWKDVYLESFSTRVIRYVISNVRESGRDDWIVRVGVVSEGSDTAPGKFIYNITVHDTSYAISVPVTSEEENHAAEILVPKTELDLWWPNGYGKQPLYQLVAQYRESDTGELSEQVHNIGFRTLELIQDETSGNGTDFYFRVNNVPIFVKGFNIVPLHILPELGQDPELVDRVLGDALAVNINMLRVWGGGVYESDYFYNAADRLGLLIWQDFMFARSVYPATDDFLINVREEVRHQVMTLYNHPSIAIWCGNSENELVMNELARDPSYTSTYDLYEADYIKLFTATVKVELEKIYSDNNLLFIPSSPSNGIAEDSNGYITQSAQNPNFGDVHYYNYALNSLDTRIYPVTRFTSEYGYQSVPDLDSWATTNDNPSDFQPFSEFMIYRQHQQNGQNIILDIIEDHFNIPTDTSHSNYNVAYIFFSQVSQALSIKVETEYYRTFTGRYNEQGQGNNMGLLLWQLNDVWVAPTWSSIDFTGKWKMLHYALKDCFATNLITGHLTNEGFFEVYIISEQLGLIGLRANASVHIDVYKWDSFDRLHTDTLTTEIVFGTARNVFITPIDDYLLDMGCGTEELQDHRSNCFFRLSFEIADPRISAENFAFPAELRDSNIIFTDIRITQVVEASVGTEFDITVETNNIVVWVWLDSHQVRGRFSRNGFHLIERHGIVRFSAMEATTVEALQAVLTVTSVNDPKYY